MLEWEAEDAREEMEIAKAAMEKYLKGMQYSERFWEREEIDNFSCFNNSFNNKQSSKSSRRKKV